MLQRIQTVLLALMVIFTFVLFFVPTFTLKNDLITVTLGAFGTTVMAAGKPLSTSGGFMIAVIAGLGILITSYSIFSFKKRPLQLKLSLLNTLIYLSLLAVMVYYQSALVEKYSSATGGIEAKYGFGFFVPAICLLLNMIAARFIRKDEKMVKDAFERLR
ncbi:MAG TPA: DUF4293 domain-containing protein [Cytophagales bacterium]|nr:DUF4293 domain-containing protein [Cytophagales bacterium]